MKRNELLESLHHINIGVELTVLSSEMALECEYVTSLGYGSCWLSYDAWPAVEIQNISPEKFTEFQEKLKVHNLMITDLEGTQLLDFYEANVSEDADAVDLNTFFAPFLDLDKPENGIIYAIVINIEEPAIIDFYTDYDKFSCGMMEFLGNDVTKWDDCSEEELEHWVQRLEFDFKGIPCGCYGEFSEEQE